MLKPQEVQYLKENQNLITQELLDELRKTKEGKQQALDILETPKNEKRYYLDAFGQPISFDGNKSLKRADTQMALHDIHVKEIERSAQDFEYFRENYIKIKTPTGVGFPDMRPYQDRFIKKILDDNEEVVGLMGRQCIAGETMLELQDRIVSIKELFETCDTENPSEF